MPKKIDPAVKERALRMFADHRQDYPPIPRWLRRWPSSSGPGLTACPLQPHRLNEVRSDRDPMRRRSARRR
jgi:hypothetical protein